MGRSSRPVPITAILEIRLKNRLHDQQGRRLHYPVSHRRYAQRPQLPIRLRNVHAPYRFGLIALGAQSFLDFIEKTLHSRFRRFDLFNRHAVHSRCALVRSHTFPSCLQRGSPKYPPIQRVEAKLRLLLGLLAQLLSQLKELFRQSVAARLLVQGFDMLSELRSGIFIQSGLPSSYKSMLSVRPLRSARITGFRHYYEPLRIPARAGPEVMSFPTPLVELPLPPCRASQVPRLIYSRALPPTTPESSAGAVLLLPC